MEPYAQIYLALIALRQGKADSALALAQAALATSLEVRNVETQITALFQIAEAELVCGRTDAATAAFERAQAIAIEHSEPLRFDAAAGLARVALARGDGAGALRAIEGLLAHIADDGLLDGTESRQRIQLTCYQVLAGAGDTRAAGMLSVAHADLQRHAHSIADAGLRHSFLNNVPEHREVAAAWSALQATCTQATDGGLLS